MRGVKIAMVKGYFLQLFDYEIYIQLFMLKAILQLFDYEIYIQLFMW